MTNFIRYIGVILVLVGVLVIAVPALRGATTNTTLIVGIVLELLGFILHIVLNRKAFSHEEKTYR